MPEKRQCAAYIDPQCLGRIVPRIRRKNPTLGSQPSSWRALVELPRRWATSAGRYKRSSLATYVS
jgi:hypothetical protein